MEVIFTVVMFIYIVIGLIITYKVIVAATKSRDIPFDEKVIILIFCITIWPWMLKDLKTLIRNGFF